MIDVVRILKDLISIPSIDPMGSRDSSSVLTGENLINEYIKEFLRSHGLDLIKQETDIPGMYNIGAMLYRGKSYPTIVLQAHSDTVDIQGNEELLVPKEKNGRIYGRGSCDDKGGLAALLAAIAKASRKPSSVRNNIVVLAVVDEEYTWYGSKALVAQEPSNNADFGLVCEPTSCRIVNGHKGVARWNVAALGRSCHSAQPEMGENAIYRMARIISCIEKYQKIIADIKDPLLGKETISTTTIHGGTAPNVVPDRCTIEIDRRLTRGTLPEQARLSFIEYLDRQVVDSGSIEVSELQDAQQAFLIPEKHPGVRLLKAVAQKMKLNTIPHSVSYGSDAFRMNAAGIPTVLWGPGSIDVAHSDEEYCDLQELHKAASFYQAIMKEDLRDYGIKR